jgi:predicted RNA-binding protein with RPS1 domain
VLFADATEAEAPAAEDTDEDVPTEVVALDGVESVEEAHNAERPARNSIKKKRPPRGKPLSEFEVGSTVKATVKSVTSYGAFCDFGAASDGLLHISRMSKDFVSDVSDVLKMGQEVEVRIVDIDTNKNQVALSLLSEAEEQESKDALATRSQPRQQRQQRQQAPARRDDSGILAAVQQKGYNPDQFVTGKVVSTVPFGAFVRIDAKQINEELEGEFDGLVHISALTAGRAESVTAVVNVDDVVQVRVMSIGDGKVALSMISVEEQSKQAESRSQIQDVAPMGAADWKDSLEKMQKDMPVFENRPLIVELRK